MSHCPVGPARASLRAHSVNRKTGRRPAVLATTAALLALAGMPAAADAATKGVVSDISWDVSSSEQDRSAAAQADLGVKWTRINVSWAKVETSNGSYSSQKLSFYDRAIDLTRQNGSQVLVMVSQSPQWASGSSNIESRPQNPADYADFVKFLASRWRGKVDAMEIWNEQNLDRFWPGGPDASQYVSLLKPAHGAIKSVAPEMQVVFGGMFRNDWQYLEAAYAAEPNLGAYFDVMATHPYSFPTPGQGPEAMGRGGDGRITVESFGAYREVRQTMLAHGHDRPIWFTEMGWSTTTSGAWWGVSEDAQADLLRRAYSCIEQDPYVQVALWYNLRNNWYANNADTWDDQLGLMRVDYSRKPAYEAFKQVAPGQGGCTYNDPAAAPPPPAPEPAPAPAPAAAPAQSQAPKPSGRVVLRVRPVRGARASANGRRRYRVTGRLIGARSGRILFSVHRKTTGGFRIYGKQVKLRAHDGRFSRTIRLSRGRWGVLAHWYTGPRWDRDWKFVELNVGSRDSDPTPLRRRARS